MDEMVDRLCDLLVADGCGNSDRCEKMARRILDAMLDPTEEMVLAGARAGVDQIHYKCNYWDRSDMGAVEKRDWLNSAKYCWRGMIEAALATPT